MLAKRAFVLSKPEAAQPRPDIHLLFPKTVGIEDGLDETPCLGTRLVFRVGILIGSSAALTAAAQGRSQGRTPIAAI
jgi:hypothetical protein